MKFAICVSRFNQQISQRLLECALLTFKKNRILEKDIRIVWVPGAFEIPLAAQKLAQTKKYNAIVCLGCVLRGETSHNQYISLAASSAIMKLSLKYEIPVTFGILTPNNRKQALARSEKNSANKGMEATEAALEMVELLSHGI